MSVEPHLSCANCALWIHVALGMGTCPVDYVTRSEYATCPHPEADRRQPIVWHKVAGSNLGDGIPMICRRRDECGDWKYTVGLKYMTDLTLPTGPVPFATFDEYAILV